MPNNDGRRVRPGEEGKPGLEGAKGWENDPVGKQSRIDQEFGLVASGGRVQRRASGSSEDLPRPGKQSLVDAVFGSPVRSGLASQPADDTANVHAAAAKGVATPASSLPYRETIQRAFGRHDVSAVEAHTGNEASASARGMGADAYATGNHIILGGRTDLHTVAHEAAHVVQQRGGVQLKGGVGAVGDAYEQQADAVADRVAAGESAVSLLDQMSGGGHSVGAVQRAPAMPASPDSADTSPGDPAAFARFQGLLTRAGLSVVAQQLPAVNLLIADATRISNLLLQAQPSLVGIGPRMVAARLMQDVVSGGVPTSIAAVVRRLAAFAPIIMLRPDGYVCYAVSGEAIQRAGKTEFVNGELHAGGLVAGTFYYSSGGVFYRASDSLGPMGPPIGELGLEHDAVNSALDGTADALVGMAAGLYQLIRHPIDSITALRQLPGAIAQLIENSPEYWELFRVKPLNDQIRDVSKLVTTLATMYGGAVGATTRIAAGVGDLGNVTIRALTLSGRGELAWATVSVPVGTVATALSGGPGAVYVLHMANSSLNNSGGSGGGGGGSDGGARPADLAKEHGESKSPENASEHAETTNSGQAPSSVRRGPSETIKEHYLKHRSLLEKVLKKRYPKWQEDNGLNFLNDLDELISSGRLRYRGKGTLKINTPVSHIYEGEGLTLVLRQDGSFWTLLESGTGMAATIKYVP
jgi:uncharacterized protein DUF4157